MIWLLLCAIVAATIALALIAWRKWIAPWRQVEELVTEIGRGEQPRTFLIHGGVETQRIGLRLEKIFNDLKQLSKQIAKRESGMQTIFSAMQDALLVVDSNRQVILTNQTFRKLFELPEISIGTPLLEIVSAETVDGAPFEASRLARPGPAYACAIGIGQSELAIGQCRSAELLWRSDSRLGKEAREETAQRNC